MSKIKNTGIDLDALRTEFPGVTDDRLSHVVDFRSVKRPATAVKVADAVMAATGAMEFECLPNVTGDPSILRVWVNNTISGGVEAEATWTDGKWSGGHIGEKVIRSAAEFARQITGTAPQTVITVAPEASQAVTPVQDTPAPVETPAPVKGSTDRVEAALRAAEAKVKARGSAPVSDTQEAFDDVSDRIAAGLAIMEGPGAPDTLPVAGPVPVVEVPEVIRTARHITPPADLVIPFAKRVMHVVRHHGDAVDVPGALSTPARRSAVASAITVDLQDLCANVRDIDGMGTHLVDIAPEAVKLMDWARETLGHLRSLALSNKTRPLMSGSKRKNVKGRMRDRFELIMSPEFGETLNKRMADRA